MNPTYCESKQLLGITIRTRNEDEKSPETAKISGLWKTFYETIYKKVLHGTLVYGLYSGYESDYTGYFTVSAAVEKAENSSPAAPIQEIEVQEGQYLKFTPKTSGDDAFTTMWKLWQQVWAFFSDASQQLKRAYTTDYEVYHPTGDVELYIAVKKSS